MRYVHTELLEMFLDSAELSLLVATLNLIARSHHGLLEPTLPIRMRGYLTAYRKGY